MKIHKLHEKSSLRFHSEVLIYFKNFKELFNNFVIKILLQVFVFILKSRIKYETT